MPYLEHNIGLVEARAAPMTLPDINVCFPFLKKNNSENFIHLNENNNQRTDAVKAAESAGIELILDDEDSSAPPQSSSTDNNKHTQTSSNVNMKPTDESGVSSDALPSGVEIYRQRIRDLEVGF